ncbi:DUF1566 domain-containing protein [bacterium]|nr:DUF1566 domain-containing protein [bacterium]MBU1599611.1 DUF1566 domain-containing protein [bacterium]
MVLLALGRPIYAGVPSLIHYQGKLTNAGSPVDGTRTVNFSIFDVGTGGTLIWQETRDVYCTGGLFSVLLGGVTPLNPADLINEDSLYLELVVAGTTLSPRQRIASSVFSFMAGQAGTATFASTATYALTAGSLNGHYIGELYGGGIVFWVDHTGQHGLIASLVNMSTGQAWSNVTGTLIGTTAQSSWNGQGNSTAIMNQSGHMTSAAKLCDEYTNIEYGTGIYSDWYLPAIDELGLIYNAKYILRKNIEGVGGASGFANYYYWSSSEYSSLYAWIQYFFDGFQNYCRYKYNTYYVRAVRAF